MLTALNSHTTYVGIAKIMCSTLQSLGHDSDSVLKQVGISFAKNPGDRISLKLMQDLWRACVVVSGREDFGLCVAKHVHPAALHGLGFSWLASETLLDAFVRLVRYYRVVSTFGGAELVELNDILKVNFKHSAPPFRMVVASVDAATAVFVQLCRMASSAEFNPARIQLLRPPPKTIKNFEEFFRCPIEFESNENSICFHRDELEKALPLANADLARGNDKVVIDYLKQYDRNSIHSQVRASIIDHLPSGKPSQQQVAYELNQSIRTLQRRLGMENLTYKGLVDEVRLELATKYLMESRRSIGEITYLLGFSEHTSFTRAFKRWTSVTPNDFREEKHN